MVNPRSCFYGSVPQHRTLRFDPNSTAPIWVELEQAQTALEAAKLMLDLERARLDDAEARIADINARTTDALSRTPAMPEFIQLAGAVRAAEAKLGRVMELSVAQLAPTSEVAAAEAELAIARATFDAAIRTLRKDLSAAGLDAAAARVAVAEARVKLDEQQNVLDALSARCRRGFRRRADWPTISRLWATLDRSPSRSGPWQEAAGLPVTGTVGPSHFVIAPGPVHIAAHSASIGETLTASSPDRGSILDYTSTQKLITVPLGIGDQALAAVGRTVTITLADDTRWRARSPRSDRSSPMALSP